jgi:hypothetical protein
LLRQALGAELRRARYTARHAAAHKPARWTAVVATAAAAGAIAGSVGGAPLANAMSLADGHAAAGQAGTTVTRSTVTSQSAPASRVELTSKELAKPAQPAPVDIIGQSAAKSLAMPVLTPKTPTAATQPPAASAPAATAPATGSMHASARPAVQKHAAAAAKPSTIYDSVTPSSIPAGADAAVYSNGAYQASTAQVAGRKHVLWIDTNGSNTSANALDVEPGDATPAGAAAWVQAKLSKDHNATAIVYTFKSDWGQVISDINALPGWMHSHVQYWIADPTGTPHILSGATATQWYWGANYDITSASPGFGK